MPYRKRIGFQSDTGPELLSPDSYVDIAQYVREAIPTFKPGRPIYNANRSKIIAPNLLSLIIQDTSMVEMLEKEDEHNPRLTRIGGVAIAIDHDLYDPTLAIPDTAVVLVLALDRMRLREESDQKDLMMLLSNRVRADNYPGGLINEQPVISNV